MSAQDVQALMRLMTTGRNKVTLLQAMPRIKALQGAGFKSISDIATASLDALTAALGDEKVAKPLQAACKKESSSPSGTKRPAESDAASTSSKRKKSAYELEGGGSDAVEPLTPAQQEAALELPSLPAEEVTEDVLPKVVLRTNRAPLVLAFAVQLLKYTQPDQPLSSRLSLGQAVVSLNSRTKAVSLGLAQGDAAKEGWGEGQPKVVIMGREVPVLKRGGYVVDPQPASVRDEDDDASSDPAPTAEDEAPTPDTPIKSELQQEPKWSTSAPITERQSTFVARVAHPVTTPTQAKHLIATLMTSNPSLLTATHNVTAWRISKKTGWMPSIIEDSDDDGESGAGRHILSQLREAKAENVLVVMTRWYGGVMLGPRRWTIMTSVVRDALAQRLRVAPEKVITQPREALWGLDLEGMKDGSRKPGGDPFGGMPIHRPETARAYLLRSFASASPPGTETGEGGAGDAPTKGRGKTKAAEEREKERNLALLLATLDLLFASWEGHVTRLELDSRAWSWYVAVRPDTDWGGKGDVKLADILNLRRKG